MSPPSQGRLRRLLLVGLAVAMIGGSLAIDADGLVAVPVLFLLVVPFEKLFPRHRQRVRRPHLGTDIGYALAGPLLSGIGLAAAVVVAGLSLAWLPGLAVRPLVMAMPPAVAPFVGIALFDLAIYWTHRWYHEVPVLWRFHAIHHSPQHMDWVSGFRSHPFDGTLIAPAFVFLLAAGFSAEFTGVLAVVQFVLGIFLHANVRWRLRPLHPLIITPEFHHWHHANEPGAVNSNYSVFLPAWDLLFGSYFMPRDRRPQVYGVSEPIPTGMAAQLWHPMRGMGNPLRVVRHPIRSCKGGLQFTGRLLGDMKQSAMRPRRTSHGTPSRRPVAADGATGRSAVLLTAPRSTRSPTWPAAPPPVSATVTFAPPRPLSSPPPAPVDPPTVPYSPYSPYFEAPSPAPGSLPLGSPAAPVGKRPTELYHRATPLAEIMQWDDLDHRG